MYSLVVLLVPSILHVLQISMSVQQTLMDVLTIVPTMLGPTLVHYFLSMFMILRAYYLYFIKV